jgi:hypothetical protein
MAFPSNNMESLHQKSRHEYEQHCGKPDVLVASVREHQDGLAVHHCKCSHIQNSLKNHKADVITWQKFGFFPQEFPVFQEAAHKAKIQLWFTCSSTPCRENLRRVLGNIVDHSPQ